MTTVETLGLTRQTFVSKEMNQGTLEVVKQEMARVNIDMICLFEGTNKPVHIRTQEKGAVTPGDEPRLACECPGVSSRGMG